MVKTPVERQGIRRQSERHAAWEKVTQTKQFNIKQQLRTAPTKLWFGLQKGRSHNRTHKNTIQTTYKVDRHNYFGESGQNESHISKHANMYTIPVETQRIRGQNECHAAWEKVTQAKCFHFVGKPMNP